MKDSTREEIRRRTPEGWYGLSSPAGWDDIVEDLFLKLVEKYPDLKVYQIKEKFGGLRFYSSAPVGPEIGEAEALAWRTCQKCGAQAHQFLDAGWVRTLCGECMGLAS